MPPTCPPGQPLASMLPSAMQRVLGKPRGRDADGILSSTRVKAAPAQAEVPGLRASFLLITLYTTLCVALGPRPLPYVYKHTFTEEGSCFLVQNRSLHTILPLMWAFLVLVPAHTHFQVQSLSLSCENSGASCLLSANLRFVFSIWGLMSGPGAV